MSFSLDIMNRILIYSLSLLLLALLFQTQYYRVLPKEELDAKKIKILEELGEEALLHKDVPIAALLMYKDSLIGYGYNTVLRDAELSGHAEVNAINMAYKSYGKQFAQLDREDLVIYSSFEPCEMCKGMLLHYNIKEVRFERKKKIFRQVKSSLKTWLYEYSKRQVLADSLQEKLFLKHPDYKPERE